MNFKVRRLASKLSCCRKWHHYCLDITSTFGVHQLIVSWSASPLWFCIFFPCVIWYLCPPHLKINPIKTTHGWRSKWEFQVVNVIASYRLVVLSDAMWLLCGWFPKIGIPQNGWFTMENPIRMEDLGVPLFSETSMYVEYDHENYDLQSFQLRTGGLLLSTKLVFEGSHGQSCMWNRLW